MSTPEHERSEMPILPIANWDTQEVSDEGKLVWWTRLDDRFQVEVHRQGDSLTMHHAMSGERPERSNLAMLRVFDHSNENKLLLDEEVGLAYDAIFGPDVDDVEVWQERVLHFVDIELPQQNQQ